MKVEFQFADKRVVSASVGEESVVVGRLGGDADLQLDGDPGISRRHGRLWVEDGIVWYQDLGSSNGSWYEGARIKKPVPVDAERTVTLGRTQLRLALAEAPREAPQYREAGLTLQMRGEAGQQALTTALGRSEGSNYIGVLAELVAALLKSSDPGTVLEILKQVDRTMLGQQTISVVAWPPHADGQLRYLISPIKGEGAAISHSLCRRAAELKEGLLFSESSADAEQFGMSAILKGIRSAVYTPLLGPSNDVLGILCVDRTTPGLPIDEETFQFIRAVGGLLSTSLSAELLREEARKKELESREAEARREGLAKFLSIASHDLKNPLTIVLGCSKLIEKVDDLDKVRLLNGKILKAGERARSLIKAYLEVSELTSGADLTLNLQTLDLGAMIDEEIGFLQDAGNRSENLTFVNEVEMVTLNADAQKLQQVLSNLISNAAKYSPKGGEVRIWAEVAHREVTLKVKDQGVGISEEDQKKLFKQFQRVGDQSLVAGTGLGLWLTSALIQAHGGNISVESQEGQGSTFNVTLPLSPPVNRSRDTETISNL